MEGTSDSIVRVGRPGEVGEGRPTAHTPTTRGTIPTASRTYQSTDQSTESHARDGIRNARLPDGDAIERDEEDVSIDSRIPRAVFDRQRTFEVLQRRDFEEGAGCEIPSPGSRPCTWILGCRFLSSPHEHYDGNRIRGGHERERTELHRGVQVRRQVRMFRGREHLDEGRSQSRR